MARKFDTEIKQPSDSRSQYLRIPYEIVIDSRYPFKRDEPYQEVSIEIDETNKTLVIKQK